MSLDLGDGSTDDDLEVASVLANGLQNPHHQHGKSTTPSSNKLSCPSNPQRAATVMTNVSRWNTVTLTPCHIEEQSVHSLAAYGEISQLKQDLNGGSNLNSVDDQGMSPLMWASYFGQNDTVSWLLEMGADTAITSHVTGATALILATVRCHLVCVELLLCAGAETNCMCKEGNSPLHYAVQANLPQFVAVFLEWGADIMCTNNTDVTPYQLALKNRFCRIQSLMEQHMLTFAVT